MGHWISAVVIALCAGLATTWGALAAPDTAKPCVGDAIPARASTMLPPKMPKPVGSSDIVGLILQNTASSSVPDRYIAFAQFFAKGQVLPADKLVLHAQRTTRPVQMDDLALWADGSVKLASIIVSTGHICAGTQVPAMLAKATPEEKAAFPTASVDLAAASFALTAKLTFAPESASYAGTVQQFDIAEALKIALAAQPDYWLRGPLATQARVDIPIEGAGNLHISADVTVFADGNVVADVQYNNDIATIVGKGQGSFEREPGLRYTVDTVLGGRIDRRAIGQQYMYQDWHTVLYSNGNPGINVQHDPAYLVRAGAVLPYDFATGVSRAAFDSAIGGALRYNPQNAGHNAGQAGPDFGEPLSPNGIAKTMGTTGGRGDIGYTTIWNAMWIVTQDADAAKVGLAQGDTAGAAPWNYKLKSGHWATLAEVPGFWPDERSATTVASYSSQTKSWQTDTSHFPDLSYVPYIATGSRWYLDRMNAQASFALAVYPGEMCGNGTKFDRNSGRAIGSTCDYVVNGASQVRAQAWSLRNLEQAAMVGRPGTFEHAAFNAALAHNWTWIQQKQSEWNARQGETAGWVPAYYPHDAIGPWQQFMLAGSAAFGARLGDEGAKQFLGWQIGWMTGFVLAPNANRYDIFNYYLRNGTMKDGAIAYYRTWKEYRDRAAADGTAVVPSAAGQGTDYAPRALSALAAALSVFPDDARLRRAYDFVEHSGAANIGKAAMSIATNLSIAPIEQQNKISRTPRSSSPPFVRIAAATVARPCRVRMSVRDRAIAGPPHPCAPCAAAARAPQDRRGGNRVARLVWCPANRRRRADENPRRRFRSRLRCRAAWSAGAERFRTPNLHGPAGRN